MPLSFFALSPRLNTRARAAGIAGAVTRSRLTDPHRVQPPAPIGILTLGAARFRGCLQWRLYLPRLLPPWAAVTAASAAPAACSAAADRGARRRGVVTRSGEGRRLLVTAGNQRQPAFVNLGDAAVQLGAALLRLLQHPAPAASTTACACARSCWRAPTSAWVTSTARCLVATSVPSAAMVVCNPLTRSARVSIWPRSRASSRCASSRRAWVW